MQRRVHVFGVIYETKQWCKKKTDWSMKVENELEELMVQDDMHIKIKKVRKQIRKTKPRA